VELKGRELSISFLLEMEAVRSPSSTQPKAARFKRWRLVSQGVGRVADVQELAPRAA
jgi:hypothetical protein